MLILAALSRSFGDAPDLSFTLPPWAKILGLVLLALVGLLICFVAFRSVCIREVPPEHRGARVRRGQVVRKNLTPAWYYINPLTEKIVSEFLGVQREHFEEETRTKDNSIVAIIGAVHFRVIEAMVEKVMFGLGEKPKVLVKDLVTSALRSAVSTREAAQAYEGKDEIAKEVIEHVKARLAELGFELIDVPITQVAPHKDVVKAINDVQSALRATEAERARAEATKIKMSAAAEGQKAASALLGQGEADRLSAQAAGYLKMLRTMTGNENFALEPRAAAAFALQMRQIEMRIAFAQTGRASSVVLPDGDSFVKEIAELVPALVAHEHIEGAGEKDENGEIDIEALSAEVRNHLGEESDAEGFLEKLKSGALEEEDEVLGKLPFAMRFVAKRLLKRARRAAVAG